MTIDCAMHQRTVYDKTISQSVVSFNYTLFFLVEYMSPDGDTGKTVYGGSEIYALPNIRIAAHRFISRFIAACGRFVL